MMDTHVISHQNVRLSRGAHRSPDEGACVMELVSMLAGEPFSDRPETACPVIGAVLRAFNDLADDERRQELLECAAAVVGSRRPELEDARARHCVAVALDYHSRQPRWRRVVGGRRRLAALATARRRRLGEADIAYVAWSLAAILRRAPGGGGRAVELVHELVAMGAPAVEELPRELTYAAR